jgi:multidrug efflux pump subunit AcrA (membrane-fusion protein)
MSRSRSRTEAELRTELATGKSLADVAVAHGKDRAGLVAALTAAASTQIQTLVDTKNPLPAGRVGGGPGGLGESRLEGDDLTATATYLGITEADLRTKMQAGQTLAQIAAATSGKTRDGLIQALVTAETTEIDAALTAGKITAADATAQKATLTAQATAIVDNTRPAGIPGGRGRR